MNLDRMAQLCIKKDEKRPYDGLQSIFQPKGPESMEKRLIISSDFFRQSLLERDYG